MARRSSPSGKRADSRTTRKSSTRSPTGNARPVPPDIAMPETAPHQHGHVILGTAGHIDHGKTSLVKRLTGIDTDRLPEEQARGMTIDLGFAHLDLAGKRVSL